MPELKRPKICGVCGEVLHQFKQQPKEGWPASQTQAVTVTASEWIHSKDLTGKVDHPAVPVDYDERNLVSQCDFCGGGVASDERWYLDAEDFEVLVIEGLRHNSRSGWGACPTCVPLVAKKDWPALIERHMLVVGSNYQPNVFEFLRDTMLPALFNALEAHTLAPIRPWQPGDELSNQE